LENIVQKTPFLRLTVALAFGVYMGSVIDISILFLISASVILLFCLILIQRYYSYYLERWFGLIMQVFLVIIGLLSYKNYNEKPELYNKGIFMATILEKPQEKENSFKSVLEITHVKTNSSVFKTNEKVLVYFKKNEAVKELSPGENIVFNNCPQMIRNNRNPFEFDYKKYLLNKKIYRQAYLATDKWKKVELPNKKSIVLVAEEVREKLLTVFRNQQFEKNELEILSALTLGYKRGLDPETKRVFSSAGAMHVLAVSGLHVGIIFWVFSILFGFLKKVKSGRIIFVIFSIIILWFYAFITGLSPSVMRAATMFSIFVVGDNLKRKANTYNSLAASAMFLLLINPNNLFEVGFQLSYLAVFGIVFLQPKFSGLIQINNKILKFFWSLLTVSVSAQIATFPLTAFYFNQFPTYFWLTNILIIPAVMILIPAGMLLLVFAKVPLFSEMLSIVLQTLLKSIYRLLFLIEQLPHSILYISINFNELVLLFGILASLFLMVNKFKVHYFKFALVFLLILALNTLILSIHQSNNRQVIVYNTPDNLTAQIIYGKENIIISERKIQDNEHIHSLIQTTNLKSKLNKPQYMTQNDSLSNRFVHYKNGVMLFDRKTLLFNKSASGFDSITPHFVLINKNTNILKDQISPNTRIISNNRYFKPGTNISKQFHNTDTQGAFVEKW